MLAERQRLTTNPLTMSEGVNLQVQDVYVPLGLVERKKISKLQDDHLPKNQDDNLSKNKNNNSSGITSKNKNNNSSGINSPRNEISAESGSEIYKESESKREFKHDEFLTQVFKEKNTPKSKGKRIAIIGEPGAGKTTLLQQISDYLSKESNQSIVIWVSLADLQGKKLEKYLEATTLNKVISKQGRQFESQIKDDFEKQFHQGQVWLLLDGLDEMSVNAGNALTDIARQIRDSGYINQARIVLTCRLNLWDGGSNALNEFDIYKTSHFSYPEDVERFIDKWFTAIPEPDRERGQRLCNALKEPGKERIQDLVKNPLCLTLLCLNWQAREGKLPDTQAELYQKFVDDIYEWKEGKFLTTVTQHQQLNIKLGELAREAIDKETNRFYLPSKFVNQFLREDEEGKLLRLAIDLGWLNDVIKDMDGKSVYAFFHASFQEYFAATVINDWDFFLPRNHKNKPIKNKKYRIFEPKWEQTILLWFGRKDLPKKEKEAFIQALINFKDGCVKYKGKGFYEYRAYFLAAAAIVEFKDCDRADKIAQQVVNWQLNNSNFPIIQSQIKAVFQETENTTSIIEALVHIINKSRDDKIRFEAAYILSDIGTRNKKAIACLVKLMEARDGKTSVLAAASLLTIDRGSNRQARATLKRLLYTAPDNFTRMLSAKILVNIEYRNTTIYEEAKVALNKIPDRLYDLNRSAERIISDINSTEPNSKKIKNNLLIRLPILLYILLLLLFNLLYYLRLQQQLKPVVYLVLDKLGDAVSEEEIDALVQCLLELSQYHEYEYYEIWMKAVYRLRGIGIGNEKVITALVQLLATSPDEGIRREAADCLAKIAIGNEKAITALVRLLATPQSQLIYWQVVGCLEKIDPSNEHLIAALVQLLETSHHYYNSIDAARYLERIGIGNGKAIAALEELLEKSKDNFTRRWVAEGLGTIDPGNEKAVSTLVELLEKSKDYYCEYRQIAYYLGKIGIGNKEANAALVKILDTSENKNLLENEHLLENELLLMDVVESIGKIGVGNEKTITALVEIYNISQIYLIRNAAVKSLGSIVTGDETTITALVQLLDHPEYIMEEIHKQVVKSLGNIGNGNEKVITVLLRLANSKFMDIYKQAVTIWELGNTKVTGYEKGILALKVILALYVLLFVLLLCLYSLLDNSEYIAIRQEAVISLGNIGTDNEKVITALVKLMTSSKHWKIYTQAADSLEKIATNNKYRSLVIQALSSHKLDDSKYNLIWKYAQNMPYPDFYQAWHQSKSNLAKIAWIPLSLLIWLLL